ncbi:MAG: Rrf2 family transcriptional regulator [bacterium]
MQVTRETDYAIRCILFLSQKLKQNISAAAFSKELKISQAFISKIIQKLVKAGLLQSVRGVGGGVQLKKSPGDISLFDIVDAIQGPLGVNICVVDKKSCDRSSSCAVHPAWMEIQAMIERKLKSYSIKKLMERAGRGS